MKTGIKKRNERDEEIFDIDEENNMEEYIQIEIEEYNSSTWKRLLKRSKFVPSPPNKGLDTPCLIWNGKDQVDGYGRIYYRDRKLMINRVSIMIDQCIGTFPEENANGEMHEACHKCNIPLCIEPTHLYIGTKVDNGADRSKNGLQNGENNHGATITQEQAKAIKLSKLKKDDIEYETQQQRAEKFNVPISLINSIDQGSAWADLPFIDGTTSIEKSKKKNERVRAHKKQLKEIPWTKEQWIEAEEKYRDPKLTRVHPTKIHDDISCLEWIGGYRGKYGRISLHGLDLRAHVVACTIGNNYVRPKGLDAAHKCGFNRCVEHRHLKFETREENMADKIEHGTYSSKLTPEQVKEIRDITKEGIYTKVALGVKYNVSASSISKIVANINWKHI